MRTPLFGHALGYGPSPIAAFHSRTASNFGVQAVAGDIMRVGSIFAMQTRPARVYVLGSAHDSFVIEAPTEEIDAAVAWKRMVDCSSPITRTQPTTLRFAAPRVGISIDAAGDDAREELGDNFPVDPGTGFSVDDWDEIIDVAVDKIEEEGSFEWAKALPRRHPVAARRSSRMILFTMEMPVFAVRRLANDRWELLAGELDRARTDAAAAQIRQVSPTHMPTIAKVVFAEQTIEVRWLVLAIEAAAEIRLGETLFVRLRDFATAMATFHRRCPRCLCRGMDIPRSTVALGSPDISTMNGFEIPSSRDRERA